jgi:acylphosphatase
MADPIRVVRVRIEGRVQGVNYRAWTQETAMSLGLAGWVRNCRGGAVEALFAGVAGAVETMLERCRKGPLAARVAAVTIEQEGGEAPIGFEIKPTR